MPEYPKPPFRSQQQPMPGNTGSMDPVPDHGEDSYKGSGRLKGKHAIITDGDSGIGRAVAIAYAREGADVLISYLDEDEDAKATQALVEKAGRKAVLVRGDIQNADHCRAIVDTAVKEWGGIDILSDRHVRCRRVGLLATDEGGKRTQDLTSIPSVLWFAKLRL